MLPTCLEQRLDQGTYGTKEQIRPSRPLDSSAIRVGGVLRRAA